MSTDGISFKFDLDTSARIWSAACLRCDNQESLGFDINVINYCTYGSTSPTATSEL